MPFSPKASMRWSYPYTDLKLELTCTSAPLAIRSTTIAVSGSRCGFSFASSMHAAGADGVGERAVSRTEARVDAAAKRYPRSRQNVRAGVATRQVEIDRFLAE